MLLLLVFLCSAAAVHAGRRQKQPPGVRAAHLWNFHVSWSEYCAFYRKEERSLRPGGTFAHSLPDVSMFFLGKEKQKICLSYNACNMQLYHGSRKSDSFRWGGGKAGRGGAFLRVGWIRVSWLECVRLQREPRRSDVSISLAGRRRRGSCRHINLSRNAFSPARPSVRGRAPGESNCSFI